MATTHGADSATRTRRILTTFALFSTIIAIPAFGAEQERYAASWTVNNNAEWTPAPPSANVLGPVDSLCTGTSTPTGSWAEFTFSAFSIPGGDPVTGIEVTIWYEATTTANPVEIKFLGIPQGAKTLGTTTSPLFCSESAEVSAGGDGDVWGTGLTAADFNSGLVTVRVTQASPTLGPDAIRLKVFHGAATNTDPFAEANGPYDVDEGSSVILSSAGSGDSEDLIGDLQFAWDFDGSDFSTVESTSQNPSFSAADLDGPSSATVYLRVTDTGGLSAVDSATINVANVAPTVTLSTAGAILFPGGEAFIGTVGVEQSHSADGSDPASDDLIFDWDIDGPLQSTTYFNDTGDELGTPDPPSSPGGTFPFSILGDSASVTFDDPGLYTVQITLTDDDHDSDVESLAKIVTGGAECTRSQGYWRHQFRGKGKQHLLDPTLLTYLDLINSTSAVFSELVPAADLAEAEEVFSPGGGMRDKATRQTLAAWLNFASGAVAWDEPIDSDGDLLADTTFGELVADIELILLDPAATHDELVLARMLAEIVNLLDDDNEDCEDSSGAQGGSPAPKKQR